jgi:ferric-dicitrate binding protein FerR (iron transport regulator)
MKDNDIDKLFREKVHQLDGLPENISWNGNIGWKHYQEQFLPEKERNNKTIISLLSAAAIIVIVFFSVILNPYSKDRSIIEKNKTSEVRIITLPDGNKVWLNTNSSVGYPAEWNSENFVMSVSGEVYVEISNKKSEQYTIKADNAIIIAEKLTSFNLKAFPGKENIDIAVAKGVIRVQEDDSPPGPALLVTEGNYCSVHRSQKLIYASSITNDNYLAWKTGRLIFDDQSIATVVDILSEYYNTPIEILSDRIAYCTFSGSFEKPPLDIVLNKIQKDLNLKINYTGTKVSISGTGCL